MVLSRSSTWCRTTTLVAALSLAGVCATGGVAGERAPIRDPDRIFRKYLCTYKEIQQRRVVMQQYDYSCGAAALATVTHFYWGDNVNEETFLKLMPKLELTEAQLKDRVKNGLTLTDLRNLANKAGYQALMADVKFDELAKSKVPLIVGVTIKKHDHFAVYRGTDGKYVYLADPIRGNIRTPIATFLAQWQKNAILAVAKPNTPVKTANPMCVRVNEVDRGLLNDQFLRRDFMVVPIPGLIAVSP